MDVLLHGECIGWRHGGDGRQIVMFTDKIFYKEQCKYKQNSVHLPRLHIRPLSWKAPSAHGERYVVDHHLNTPRRGSQSLFHRAD